MPTTSDPNSQGIDFAKVEMLRRHMLLTVADMAKVMGVSRVTYYAWVKGKPVRSTNVPKVKRKLKKLLTILREGWPSGDVIALPAQQRLALLLELLGQEQ